MNNLTGEKFKFFAFYTSPSGVKLELKVTRSNKLALCREKSGHKKLSKFVLYFSEYVQTDYNRQNWIHCINQFQPMIDYEIQPIPHNHLLELQSCPNICPGQLSNITHSLDFHFQISDALPEVIEREVFHHHRRLINHAYRRTMRNLVFTLRHNEEVRDSVLSNKMTVSEFIKSHLKQ